MKVAEEGRNEHNDGDDADGEGERHFKSWCPSARLKTDLQNLSFVVRSRVHRRSDRLNKFNHVLALIQNYDTYLDRPIGQFGTRLRSQPHSIADHADGDRLSGTSVAMRVLKIEP